MSVGCHRGKHILLGLSMIKHHAKNANAASQKLLLDVKRLRAANSACIDNQDRAVAKGGNHGTVNNHTKRRRVDQNIVINLLAFLNEILEIKASEQLNGVGGILSAKMMSSPSYCV